MRKKYRILILFVMLSAVVLSAAFLPFSVFAEEEGFDVISYDTNVVVANDDSYSVTEVVKVKFKKPKSGIDRRIPLKGDFILPDGKGHLREPKRCIIKDISVDGGEFKTEEKDDDLVISIGDSTMKITGIYTYVIKYRVVNYKDKMKDRDFLKISLVPVWKVPIKDINVQMSFPTSFEKGRIKLYRGLEPKEANLPDAAFPYNIRYDKSGRMLLKGKAKLLLSGFGLTVFANLPEGYFKNVPDFNFKSILVVLSAVILAVLSSFFRFKFGRNLKRIKRRYNYPPEGVDPIEFSKRLRANNPVGEFVGEVLYLAQKGYISLAELPKTGEQRDILLTLGNVDKKDVSNTGREFARGIFLREHQVVLGELEREGWNHIADHMDRIREKIGKKVNKEGSTFSSKLVRWVIYAAAVAVPVILGLCLLSVPGFNLLIGALSSIGIIFTAAAIILGHISTAKKEAMSVRKYIIFGWFFYVSTIGIVIIALYQAAAIGLDNGFAGIICGVLSGIIAVLGRLASRMTEEGARLYSEVVGFKDFITKNSCSRVKPSMEDNSEYIFEILPYTSVLEGSKDFLQCFEGFNFHKPEWYTPAEPYGEESEGFNGLTDLVKNLENAAFKGFEQLEDNI